MKPILHAVCLLVIAVTATQCNKKDIRQVEPPEVDNWTINNTTARPLGDANWSFTIGSKVYFGGASHDLFIYDLSTKKWLGSFNYPAGFKQRWACAVAVNGNKAYIGGGRAVSATNELLQDWWEFSPDDANPWSRLPDLIVAGADGTAFVHNDLLYTALNIGNITASIQERVYMMPLNTKKWNSNFWHAAIPAGSSGFTHAWGDILYYGAGYDNTVPGNLFTQKCAAFAMESRQAQIIPAFPVDFVAAENARSFHAGGKLFVLAQDRQLYAYNPETFKWTKKKTVETQSDHGPITYAHQVDDKVYGFTTQGYVYEYNYK